MHANKLWVKQQRIDLNADALCKKSSSFLHQMTSDHNRSKLKIQDHSNEQSSSKLVPKVVPLAVKTATSRQELELLLLPIILQCWDNCEVLTGSYNVLELKERNPDTTVKIDVERDYEPDSMTRQFRRIYVCLGALKSRFKVGQRDLLGLDGCFMSGPFPMQILTAVGVDPNYGIYPLAYAIVESKNKQAWLWFLDCIGDDLELFRNSNYEVEFFEGWKPLSPLQLAVEEVISK
ncbi:mutator type transposase [Tanacetum coccineum]|uniref:Mutator type transposase n=1 Tax=Tanacetum coccineum TaxID=301880 RepID=A0ABQ4WNC6_9ASTR